MSERKIKIYLYFLNSASHRTLFISQYIKANFLSLTFNTINNSQDAYNFVFTWNTWFDTVTQVIINQSILILILVVPGEFIDNISAVKIRF